MDSKKNQNCERTKLESFLNKVQLPNGYKIIGLLLVVLSFVLMTVFKFVTTELQWVSYVLKHGMLIGLLIISLSKEKIEDELLETLRAKSYALAFIIGVGYSMLQPLANYFVAAISGSDEISNEMGYMQVLLFMLLIQVGFFELLKRTR